MVCRSTEPGTPKTRDKSNKRNQTNTRNKSSTLHICNAIQYQIIYNNGTLFLEQGIENRYVHEQLQTCFTEIVFLFGTYHI